MGLAHQEDTRFTKLDPIPFFFSKGIIIIHL